MDGTAVCWSKASVISFIKGLGRCWVASRVGLRVLRAASYRQTCWTFLDRNPGLFTGFVCPQCLLCHFVWAEYSNVQPLKNADCSHPASVQHKNLCKMLFIYDFSVCCFLWQLLKKWLFAVKQLKANHKSRFYLLNLWSAKTSASASIPPFNRCSGFWSCHNLMT